MMQDSGPSEQARSIPWWKKLGQFLSSPFRKLARWISRLLTRNEEPAAPSIHLATPPMFGMTELPESVREAPKPPPATVEIPEPLPAKPRAFQLTPELKEKLEKKMVHWQARLIAHECDERMILSVIPIMQHALYLLECSAAGQFDLGSKQPDLEASFNRLDQGLNSSNLLKKTDITQYTLELDQKVQACQMYVIQNSPSSGETEPVPHSMPPKPKKS